MRILHVNERASDFGGVERILHDTARTLADEGWSQALLHDDEESDARFAAPFEFAGSDASMRCALVTTPSRTGTFRSWRIRTRLPARSRPVSSSTGMIRP